MSKLNERGRALQHLLLQGFTLYTLPAAVCTRLAFARQILDDPLHRWAITFDHQSMPWVSMLVDEDPLKARLADAALRSADPRSAYVLCHVGGSLLTVELEVTQVREARLSIETAIARGVAPVEGDLKAVPDAVLDREVRRRERQREREAEREAERQAAAAAAAAAGGSGQPGP